MLTRTIITGIDLDRNGDLLSEAKQATQLRWIKEKAAATYGGFTAVRGQGGWIDPRGRLITENALLLTLVTDEPLDAFAQYVGRALNQEAVVLVNGNQSEIVSIDYE